MKKKMTALFNAFLCLTATITSVQVNAVDAEVDLDAVYSIATDTFTYTTNNSYGDGSGFYLESEMAAPDFMVVGFVERKNDSENPYDYVVSPINDDVRLKAGLGIMEASVVVRELGDQQLQVGDLLKIDGDIFMVEPNTVIYYPGEEGTMSCLGNGVDIFGEEFEKVIRLQLVIDQAAYDSAAQTMYDIELIKGDVNVDDTLNVLDCLSINKNLLAGAPLCDYARLAADINENGAPDTDDSLAILKETLGITENFE